MGCVKEKKRVVGDSSSLYELGREVFRGSPGYEV